MKKIEGTPYSELKIQASNIWLDLLSSLPLIIVGLFMVHISPNTTLICQRIETKQGNCKLTESKLWVSSSQEISLDDLQGGKVIQKSKGSSQVVVLTKTGGIPLGNATRWGDKNSIANQINSFVKNTDIKSLKVSQDDRWFGWIFGGIFVLSGVLKYVHKRKKIYL
ncbi:hypothetical protein [Microcoleus sp. Pol12B5]|uniref:hypothetical protein n=1 Tax=Microcoleus sp. Pol12B5 TaxID=3055396 RepID=UPI002FD31E25